MKINQKSESSVRREAAAIVGVPGLLTLGKFLQILR